jgi:hypothetical protein
VTNDEIRLGIECICAPLPESRNLRDKIIEALNLRFTALEAADEFFRGDLNHVRSVRARDLIAMAMSGET